MIARFILILCTRESFQENTLKDKYVSMSSRFFVSSDRNSTILSPLKLAVMVLTFRELKISFSHFGRRRTLDLRMLRTSALSFAHSSKASTTIYQGSSSSSPRFFKGVSIPCSKHHSES